MLHSCSKRNVSSLYALLHCYTDQFIESGCKIWILVVIALVNVSNAIHADVSIMSIVVV